MASSLGRRRSMPRLSLGDIHKLCPGQQGGSCKVVAVDASGPTRCTTTDLQLPTEVCARSVFKFGEVLGSGTVAVVRRAVRCSDSMELAVKHIVSEDTEVRKFAYEEFQLMRDLRHPAIVTVEEFHDSSSEIFISMELCQDGSVESFVTRHGTFDEIAAQALLLQLFNGVDYLHQKRVVHRDLKPDNLMLTKHARVLKITDFNSAAHIGSTDSCMLSERGTRIFMAPELKFGGIWNERVDIWACGMTMHYMLYGKLPFSVEDRTAAVALLSGKLPSFSFEGMSKLSANLLQQCLTVNMQDRPSARILTLHRFFSEGSAPCETPGKVAYYFGIVPACGLLSINALQQLQQRSLGQCNEHPSHDASTTEWMERRDGTLQMQRLADKYFRRVEDRQDEAEPEEAPTLVSLGRRRFFSRATTSVGLLSCAD
eukprot:gb/GFBE01000188.1/.p1 GENE.gb/GFBE01000188.1/~~gb/GFBE01000188.1/.p1  ORF type:complete len:427 (+),score=67.22 gb/GFBE01000188.1/:1-1281(+)